MQQVQIPHEHYFENVQDRSEMQLNILGSEVWAMPRYKRLVD